MPKPPKKLRVLTWNLFLMPQITQWDLSKEHDRRAEEIADRLFDSQAQFDVLVFQKAFHEKRRDIIVDKLKKHFPVRKGPVNQKWMGRDWNSGLFVMSKLPLELVGSHDFEAGKGFESLFPKGAMLVEGKFDGRPFQLSNAHFQGHVDCDKKNEIPGIRLDQARELKALLADHIKPRVPQIVCGDFGLDQRRDSTYPQLLKILGVEDFTVEGKPQFTSLPEPNALFGKDFVKESSVKDYVFFRNAEPQLNASTARHVERFKGQWKAGKKTDSLDLSYRFALVAEIPL